MKRRRLLLCSLILAVLLTIALVITVILMINSDRDKDRDRKKRDNETTEDSTPIISPTEQEVAKLSAEELIAYANNRIKENADVAFSITFNMTGIDKTEGSISVEMLLSTAVNGRKTATCDGSSFAAQMNIIEKEPNDYVEIEEFIFIDGMIYSSDEVRTGSTVTHFDKTKEEWDENMTIEFVFDISFLAECFSTLNKQATDMGYTVDCSSLKAEKVYSFFESLMGDTIVADGQGNAPTPTFQNAACSLFTDKNGIPTGYSATIDMSNSDTSVHYTFSAKILLGNDVPRITKPEDEEEYQTVESITKRPEGGIHTTYASTYFDVLPAFVQADDIAIYLEDNTYWIYRKSTDQLFDQAGQQVVPNSWQEDIIQSINSNFPTFFEPPKNQFDESPLNIPSDARFDLSKTGRTGESFRGWVLSEEDSTQIASLLNRLEWKKDDTLFQKINPVAEMTELSYWTRTSTEDGNAGTYLSFYHSKGSKQLIQKQHWVDEDFGGHDDYGVAQLSEEDLALLDQMIEKYGSYSEKFELEEIISATGMCRSSTNIPEDILPDRNLLKEIVDSLTWNEDPSWEYDSVTFGDYAIVSTYLEYEYLYRSKTGELFMRASSKKAILSDEQAAALDAMIARYFPADGEQEFAMNRIVAEHNDGYIMAGDDFSSPTPAEDRAIFMNLISELTWTESEFEWKDLQVGDYFIESYCSWYYIPADNLLIDNRGPLTLEATLSTEQKLILETFIQKIFPDT